MWQTILKLAAENPVIKWLVVGFVLIFGVELLGKEAISLWQQLETAKATVAQRRAECYKSGVNVLDMDAKEHCGWYEPAAGDVSPATVAQFKKTAEIEARLSHPELTEAEKQRYVEKECVRHYGHAVCDNSAKEAEQSPPQDAAATPSDETGELARLRDEGAKMPPREALFFLFLGLGAILGEIASDRFKPAKNAVGVKAAAWRQIKMSLAIVAFMFAMPTLGVLLGNVVAFDFPPRSVFGYPLSFDVRGNIVVGVVGVPEMLFFWTFVRQIWSLATSGWRLMQKDAPA